MIFVPKWEINKAVQSIRASDFRFIKCCSIETEPKCWIPVQRWVEALSSGFPSESEIYGIVN